MDRTNLAILMKAVARACPGGKLPDSYIVLDTETTGVEVYKSKVLQYGMAMVKNRNIVHSSSDYIFRPNLSIPEAAAKIHGITIDKLASAGVDYKEYLAGLVDVLKDWRSQKGMYLGHNIQAFDAILLEVDSKDAGCPFKFNVGEVIDTGMIVKAAQINEYPKDGEPLDYFYTRVARIHSRVKWSLANYCYNEFRLGDSGIGTDDAHDAEVDCKLTAHLFEKLRELCV